MGSQVEMSETKNIAFEVSVVPCEGAWVEIGPRLSPGGSASLLPVWVLGYPYIRYRTKISGVAPLIGLWIETRSVSEGG